MPKDRNVQIRKYNEETEKFDNIFPKTKKSLVEGLENELDSKADLDADGKVKASQIPPEYKETKVVQDITEMAGLETYESLLVWVIDASGDENVDEGSALYIYKDGWELVTQTEALDIEIQWTNIEGRPSSDVEDIDDAVEKKHSHDNKNVIDNISNNDIDNWNDAKDHADKESGNPHNVDKSDVGLGNVENYAIASEGEAKEGTTNTKYMTPKRTKESISSQFVIDSEEPSDPVFWFQEI